MIRALCLIFVSFFLGVFLTCIQSAKAADPVKSISKNGVNAVVARINSEDEDVYASVGKKGFVPPQVRAMAASPDTMARAARQETVQKRIVLHADGSTTEDDGTNSAVDAMIASLDSEKQISTPCGLVVGPGSGTCMSPARLTYTIYPVASYLLWDNEQCPCKCIYGCGVFNGVRYCYLICGGTGYIVLGFGNNFCCHVSGHECTGNPGFEVCPERKLLCSAP